MNTLALQDQKFGLDYEKEFLPIIETLFKMSFTKLGEFASYDFINREHKIFVEIKNTKTVCILPLEEQ